VFVCEWFQLTATVPNTPTKAPYRFATKIAPSQRRQFNLQRWHWPPPLIAHSLININISSIICFSGKLDRQLGLFAPLTSTGSLHSQSESRVHDRCPGVEYWWAKGWLLVVPTQRHHPAPACFANTSALLPMLAPVRASRPARP
jgi:hypothetical protein